MINIQFVVKRYILPFYAMEVAQIFVDNYRVLHRTLLNLSSYYLDIVGPL